MNKKKKIKYKIEAKNQIRKSELRSTFTIKQTEFYVFSTWLQGLKGILYGLCDTERQKSQVYFCNKNQIVYAFEQGFNAAIATFFMAIFHSIQFDKFSSTTLCNKVRFFTLSNFRLANDMNRCRNKWSEHESMRYWMKPYER